MPLIQPAASGVSDEELVSHTQDSTSVHGIADATALETSAGAASKVSDHAGAGDPHGVYVLEGALDSLVQDNRLDEFAPPTSPLSLNGQRLTDVGDPVSGADAVNKNTLDATAASLAWKAPARVATTVAGTLATSFENGDTVDGIVLATGDRVLIKDQAAGAENGIYVVAASGAPTRATDADTGAELVAGASLLVQAGTLNAGSQWRQSTTGAITLGTTALVFQQFGMGTSYTAGAGLEQVGNQFALDLPVSIAHGGTGAGSAAAGLAALGGITTAAAQAQVDTHAGLGDPHAGYQKESEKGAVSGYASLDGSGTIPDAQIPSAVSRDAEVTAWIETHRADTSDVHGIVDMLQVALKNVANTFTQITTFVLGVIGPLFDKGGAVHNIKAYGGVGDGVADETAALVAAMAAATAGDTILFPRGSYLFSSAIIAITKSLRLYFDNALVTCTMPGTAVEAGAFNIRADNVVIEGSGWGTLFTQPSQGGVAVGLWHLFFVGQTTGVGATAYSGTIFRNFKIDWQDENCLATGNIPYYGAFRSRRDVDTLYEGLYLTRCGNRGIDARGAIRAVVRGNTFVNTGYAAGLGLPNTAARLGGNAVSIDLDNTVPSADCVIENNYFERWGDTAAAIPNAIGFRISNNRLRGATAVGGTPISSTEAGISVTGSQQGAIVGNAIEGVTSNAIIAVDRYIDNNLFYPVRNISIVGNTVVGKGAASACIKIGANGGVRSTGVWADGLSGRPSAVDSYNIVVADNVIDLADHVGAVDPGIKVYGHYLKNVAMRGNVIRADVATANQRGIWLDEYGPGDPFTIDGNTFGGLLHTGIYLSNLGNATVGLSPARPADASQGIKGSIRNNTFGDGITTDINNLRDTGISIVDNHGAKIGTSIYRYDLGGLWRLVNMNPASINADASQTIVTPVSGAGWATTDLATVKAVGGLEAGVTIEDAWISATDELSTRFVNRSTAPVNPGGRDYWVIVTTPPA